MNSSNKYKECLSFILYAIYSYFAIPMTTGSGKAVGGLMAKKLSRKGTKLQRRT